MGGKFSDITDIASCQFILISGLPGNPTPHSGFRRSTTVFGMSDAFAQYSFLFF
jgi:hypothetical protein